MSEHNLLIFVIQRITCWGLIHPLEECNVLSVSWSLQRISQDAKDSELMKADVELSAQNAETSYSRYLSTVWLSCNTQCRY